MIKLSRLALLTGLWPIVTAFVSYALAIANDHVPICFPVLEGCTSISATGRLLPERLFFKANMIPAAMLSMLFWVLLRQWLIAVQGEKNNRQTLILYMGVVSAIFLIVYSVALGHVGDAYSLQRRIGVILYFFCMLIAQLLTTSEIGKLVKSGVVLPVYYRNLLFVCVLLLSIGLASIPVSILFPEYGHFDNILEWNYAIIMNVYFIIAASMWRHSNYRAEFKVK